MSEGAEKYSEGPWERYYQEHASPENFLSMFDHAVEHLYKAYDEIITGKVHSGAEDHLGHALANLVMLTWATENGKLPNKLQANTLLGLDVATDSEPLEDKVEYIDEPNSKVSSFLRKIGVVK